MDGGRVDGAHAQCLSFILYRWLLLTSQVRHEFHSGAKPLQNVLIQGEVAVIPSKAEKSIWLLETKSAGVCPYRFSKRKMTLVSIFLGQVIM